MPSLSLSLIDILSFPLPFLFPSVLCGAPPSVENAFLIGRKRSHYDIHSVVRYQCAEGFLQRHVPTAKCRANGKWDRPKIICKKCELAKNETCCFHGSAPHFPLFFFFLKPSRLCEMNLERHPPSGELLSPHRFRPPHSHYS